MAYDAHTYSETKPTGLSAEAKAEIKSLLELLLMPKLIYEKTKWHGAYDLW